MYQMHGFDIYIWHIVKATYNKLRHGINKLRPRQIAVIWQTTSLNALSWIKIYEFRLRFQWILFEYSN